MFIVLSFLEVLFVEFCLFGELGVAASIVRERSAGVFSDDV